MQLIVWVLMALAFSVATGFRLNVLHNNDMHSHFEEISRSSGTCDPEANRPCFGGFARVKTAVETIKRTTPNVIFLNAGDNFQGTPFFTFFKWKVVAQFIDLLDIDVMSLGNHEFDDEVAGLVPYLASVRAPNVACNLDLSGEPSLKPYIKPYHNLTVAGVQIAVVGYLTPFTKYLARIKTLDIHDEVASVRETARQARASGAKIVIALGHSGWTTDLKIGQQVEEVDLVIGGHTNTFLYTGTPPDVDVPVSSYPHVVVQSSGKKVPVVQAHAYTKYLGNLSLEFDEEFNLISYEGNPILLDSSHPKDPEVERLVKAKRREFDREADQVIGRTRVVLEGACKRSECNTGNFITDAFVDYVYRQRERALEFCSRNQHSCSEASDNRTSASKYITRGWTDAPIAILNGGSIRAGIEFNPPSGNVTLGDVLTTFPFQNLVHILLMNGTLLRRVLEHSVWNYDLTGVIKPGNFLQVSGLIVEYDLREAPGERVREVKVRCAQCTVPRYTDLIPDQMYTVITSAYMADGGDNFTLLQEAKKIATLDDTDTEILAKYVAKATPVNAEVGARLKLNGLPGQIDAPSSASCTSFSAFILILPYFLVPLNLVWLIRK